MTATITPVGGTASPLKFMIDGSTASYSGTFAAGFCHVTIQVLDGTTVVWGTTDAVQIATGGTS